MRARHLAAAACIARMLDGGRRSAVAQSYPNRPVTILTPFAAGSVTDAAARLIAQTLQESLGQSFIVENRAGAGGLLAAGAVARAKNDGYTLLLTTNSTHSVVNGLFKNVPYDPIKDFTPIARIGSFAVVHRGDAGQAVPVDAGAGRLRQGQSRQAQLRRRQLDRRTSSARR